MKTVLGSSICVHGFWAGKDCDACYEIHLATVKALEAKKSSAGVEVDMVHLALPSESMLNT